MTRRTEEPRELYVDDTKCFECGAPLPAMPDPGTPAWQGFCCQDCMDGKGVCHNIGDLATAMGVAADGVSMRQLQTELTMQAYAATDCGAYVAFPTATPNGPIVEPVAAVFVGSIVAGTEEHPAERMLSFPFRKDVLWQALEQIEKEAAEIWSFTHGCPECGEPDPYGDGLITVREDCPGCHGLGIVI